jgi:hypothetical protein
MPSRGYISKPCNGSTILDHLVTERPIVSHPRDNRLRDLAAVTNRTKLPGYILEVVESVGEGIQTTREFAARQDISISTPSERFRVAYKLGWIARVDCEYGPRKGYRYMLNIREQQSLTD